MKLTIINESNTARLIKAVEQGVLAGGSDLQKPLSVGEVSIGQVIRAIKRQRCLSTAAQDFGSTYLEQIIGNIITDKLPLSDVNEARRLFGLEPIDPSDLVRRRAKKKLTQKKQAQQI